MTCLARVESVAYIARTATDGMHFIDLDFVAFFAVVFGLYWGFALLRLPALGGGVRRALRGLGATDAQAEALLPDLPRVLQNLLLVLSSAVFYGWIHPWFVALLYASALLDFVVGQRIADDPSRKRAWLGLSLAGNLGMLGFFKYWNFFVGNVAAVIEAAGGHANLPMLQVLLPVGISFYTFQTMSYSFDVYAGRLAPRRNLVDYLVYVSFFPQLVAGPIERATQLLTQVEKPRAFAWDRVVLGFSLALWGATKKVVIADTLAPYVDEVFMMKEPPFVMVLAALFAFGVQMLADFSAYTDIARGTSRMLGLELTENFDRPYSALSTPEFWRRWHISLSSWVGDYVYTPILRSGRPGPLRTLLAIWVTFFLVGLWHGASWNFVVLGLYNAFWMSFYTFVIPLVPRRLKGWLVLDFAAWLFHTLVVLQPTGLLFREVSLARAWQHVSQPWFDAIPEERAIATVILAFAVAGTIPLNVGFWVRDRLMPRLTRSPWFLPVLTTWWAVEIVLLFLFYRDASQDFIYFQF